MTKDEMQKAYFILTMVTGDCPYEREIGKESDYICCKDNDSNCIECWKNALLREMSVQK